MVQQVIERARLGELTKIGQGGQGVVYAAPNVTTKFAASMVYKEYKAATLAAIDFTALTAMPALVEESLSYADGERLVSVAAWPCAIVADDSGSTGFVMPAIPQEFFMSLTTVKGESTTTAEFQHLLNHSSVLAARGITINDAQRYSLLREVASGLAFLHKHGVCVGDISPKNLLFSLTPREAVYFIDCDAMRINGVSALTQVETPGWTVPAGEDLATIYSDTYKLGLLGLRLLAGDHDTTNPAHLPSTTPGLLRQIITDTLTKQPQSRPLPEAWNYVLGQATEEAQYRTKTAAPAATPLAAPETPVVHSRPTANSAPPARPSLPPPSAPPAGAPPAGAPASSKAAIWAAVAAIAAVIVVGVVVVAVVLGKHKTAAPSSAPYSSTSPSGSGYDSPTAPAQAPAPAPTTPTFAPPPLALQGEDRNGDAQCAGGFALPRGYRVSPAAPTYSDVFTSCSFAIVVGQSYLANNPNLTSPQASISIAAQSPRASCSDVQSAHPNVECSGDAFLMHCAEEGADQWITCRGGNDAIVYIY
jgi:eukaryotic-like serine/threonine-protein kinase